MAKQEQSEKLFETDSEANAGLNRMAATYEVKRDARIEAGKKEVEQKIRVIEKMKELGLSKYKRGDLYIEVTVGKDGLKVKRLEDEHEEEEE